MAKIKPSKPNANNKAGGELKYGNADNIVGGPIVDNPSTGLNADKGVKGSSTLPPIKK
jgi:hypothetical protein